MGSDVSVDTDGVLVGKQTTVSFSTSNWDTEQTVTVAAAEDDNITSEEVTLTHSTTSVGSTYSASKNLRVSVIDNDTSGLVLSAVELSVEEADSTTYTVRLATEPSGPVTVTVSGMGSGVSVDTDGGMAEEQTTLSFTTSNWDREQPVTVSAAADDNAFSEEVRLSHSASGGGYDSVT
ncbi:MAG: hypothetical protein TH68_07355, partial [Candidatus Synechococcus spongiarum 142]